MTPFRTILVAVDFSERSKEAFRVACALAEPTRTRMFVLHVLDQPITFDEMGMPISLLGGDTTLHETVRDRLRDAYAPNQPIDVEFRVREGAAAEEILRAASEIGADLIVLSTHGRTGLHRLLAGSVAEAVLRRATCPVLALHAPETRPTAPGAIRVILHPTDFSDRAEAALRVARTLARDHGAHLLILHVEPFEFVEGVQPAVPLDPRTYYEPLREMRAKAESPDLKYPVEIQCLRGDPATGILRVAGDIRCDLIVLGTHGRSGVGRLLMGSVAEAVLRRSTCPTLIVKSTPLKPAEAPARPSQRSVTLY
jgi:nucleotide-binding universal stress UspA family protein